MKKAMTIGLVSLFMVVAGAFIAFAGNGMGPGTGVCPNAAGTGVCPNGDCTGPNRPDYREGDRLDHDRQSDPGPQGRRNLPSPLEGEALVGWTMV